MSGRTDYNDFLVQLDKEDLINHALQRRPDTKYTLVRVVNMVIRVFKLDHSMIGAMVKLPRHLRNSKCVLTLQRDQYKNIFRNPDCAFRCIATHLNGNKLPANSQHEIDKLKQLYKMKYRIEGDFKGKIKMDDIGYLELAFEIRITVYKSSVDEDGKVSVMIVRPTMLRLVH